MKIGVIGFGNLGEALIKGMLLSGIAESSEINVCARNESSLLKAKTDYDVYSNADLNDVIKKSEVIFFVVKKDAFIDFAGTIDNEGLKGKVLISFMAGVTINDFHEYFGSDVDVIRAMPDMGISFGQGMIGYAAASSGNDHIISNVIGKLGTVIRVEEEALDKFTALSACGLGFAAYVINSFIKAGIHLGFDKVISEKIVSHIFSNALLMSDHSQTIRKVATKGGATQKGIEYFEKHMMDDIIYSAIEAAYDELAKARP